MMNFKFHFLLLSGFLFTICKTNIVESIINHITQELLNEGGTNITGSEEHRLLLQKENGILGKSGHSVVWKGKYNEETDVAIKIGYNLGSFIREVGILRALNAMDNPEVEDNGIPRIYYHGEFLGGYFGFAMTLFDETLEDRSEIQKKNFKDLDILLIFKRAVEILKFLHNKNVVHNDIKPQNLFLRGPNVFISDFDSATLNGEQNQLHTLQYASSGLYAGRERHAMDDLESLIYSIWFVAGVLMDRFCPDDSPQAEGLLLAECEKIGEAAVLARVEGKCTHFENKDVKKAFELILKSEILSERKVPNYDWIVEVLTSTIYKINGNSHDAKFEWLQGA